LGNYFHFKTQIKIQSPDSTSPVRTGKLSRIHAAIPACKRIVGTNYYVDAFSYGAIPQCQLYFLSHFHSDHYGGLASSFQNGTIICSPVTGNLVESILKVKPQFIQRIPLDEWHAVGENGDRILLLDAYQYCY